MTELTLSQLTREMLRLTHACLGRAVEFGGDASHPGAPMTGPVFQYNIEMVIDGPELLETLDDFAERYLGPMANLLADKLKQSKMCFSYQLPLPPSRKENELDASRYRCDGMSLRGIMDRTAPVIDGVTYPRTLRFDVCGSKERAERLAA